jgi:hypothetical protein
MDPVRGGVNGRAAAVAMSELGQSRHFARRPTTSGIALETDIVRAGHHVSKVPIVLKKFFLPWTRSKQRLHDGSAHVPHSEQVVTSGERPLIEQPYTTLLS